MKLGHSKNEAPWWYNFLRFRLLSLVAICDAVVMFFFGKRGTRLQLRLLFWEMDWWSRRYREANPLPEEEEEEDETWLADVDWIDTFA